MTSTTSAPITDSQRIAAIDALRGVALLGILVMNIQSFAMPLAATANPLVYGDLNGANWWVWLLAHLFADLKFMTLFSMLFGAGIVLITTQALARGDSPARIHYRRMSWLLLFGLAHAYLVWNGDILVLYALCGMLVYPCRRWSPRALLALGVGVLAVGSLISLAMGWQLLSAPGYVVAMYAGEWQPSAVDIARELASYRGGWLQQIPFRAAASFDFQSGFVVDWWFWRAGGLMLIGMALFKLDVFSARRSRTFYFSMASLGLLVGLPLIAYGVYRDHAVNWDMRSSEFFGEQFNYWGSVPVALSYVALVMLFCIANTVTWLRHGLEAVGRMAFTNYLMQSIICTTIFYGHGLGFFGSVERTGQFAVVIGVWLAQLVSSPLWLRHFHMGPFEWVWRALTYGKRPPFRRI